MAEQAIAAAGNIIKGVGSYEAGKFNREAARAEATGALRAGNAEETRIREAARSAIGQQVAAQGSNGFQQGTGSAIDALTLSQINATMDALTVRTEAMARARAATTKGNVAYAEGKNALMVGMLGAAADGVRMHADWTNANAGTWPLPKNMQGIY